uniref:Protein kinase domain-containing protein n=1 Tax=Takifugu rubripes TaxID=31033 RepID=A0A674NS29_TAKRU
MESTGDNSENIAEDQPESWENSAEDVVSTHSRKHPFDPLGKDHLILEVLGQGTFGQVVKCYNSKNDTFEAVKILKSHADVITLADREVRILKRLQCLDPEKSHIVKFNNFFFDKEGICLSFEPLDLDLFTYIYDVKGPPLNGGNDHRIIKLLGQGNFGQVVKCYNYKTGRFEAVKILKSKSDVISMADKEVQILKRLQCLDSDECHIAKFNNFFSEKARTCLSFELRDLDLFSYISNTKGPPLNRGLALSEVRAITHQLATALHYLKTIGIIHGDIKPNNIMVVNRQEEPLNVKLADFSTAQYCGNINSNISPCTNCYSSPEVLLNCPFDEAIDMWSLGLTVVVAALGTDFIPPLNNNYDILKFIINIMGQPPDHVLDNGSTTRAFFNEDIKTRPKWSIKTVKQYDGFDDIKDEIILKQGPQTGLDLFLDLIQKMLDVDPQKRIMPLEVLLHSFVDVSEEETEKDMGLSDQSSCFFREEQEDQILNDFSVISKANQSEQSQKDTYVNDQDHLDIHTNFSINFFLIKVFYGLQLTVQFTVNSST